MPMKFIPTLSLLILATPLVAENEAKPAEKPPVPEAKQMMPNQMEFLNLPQEVRKEFGKHLSEAARLFKQKRIFEALDELDKTALIYSYSPEIHDLRGCCYVEMRAFDKALVQFQKASSFSSHNSSIDFNIAEVYFCTKAWAKARDKFEKIMAELPQNNTAFARLMEFKILLCNLKLGQKDEVAKLTSKYDFTDDSPFYYYAQATVAFEAKDMAKAEEWLRMADRVFNNANTISPWRDTLAEYGYIKSFYGNETVTE
jgi:tetratricopeptide (TPR) repeat protein